MCSKLHGGSLEEVVVRDKLFRSKGYVVRDDHGKALYALHIISDITVQRQVEDNLQKSNNFLQTIIESMPIRIFWKDRDSRFVGCNMQFARDAGYSRLDELIGKTDFDVSWKNQAELYRADDKATMESNTFKLDYEEPQTTPDGNTIWLRTSKLPLHDKANQVIGVLGFYQDITERRHADQVLQNMATKLHTMYELSPDAIMLLDDKGFIDCNSATLKIFGCNSRDDIIGKHPAEFSPAIQPNGEGSMSLASKQITIAIKSGSNLFEWIHRRYDGTEFQADVLLIAMELEGKIILQATVRDISISKQGELALERANRALRTLSACDEALVRAGNETELLNSICRLIVETGGYRMAWVGFPDENLTMKVHPVTQYGYDERYLKRYLKQHLESSLESVKVNWVDNERDHAPSDMAIRTGENQINQNFLHNPSLKRWRETAQARGYHSSIALPLKNFTGTLGVLTIYASEPDAFNEAEVTLLQELAEDMAFGIETLRRRTEHDRIASENQHHAEMLRQSLEDSIKAIANTVEMRDPYTAGHQQRVGQLAVALARELGLSENSVHGIELAASIHDLGKISIPSEILNKPGRLTDIEFVILQNHPQAGFDIIKDIKFPWPIATMVLQHHERVDGTGYPQGLKGNQILLESRITAVADVVEAMASHRPYRAALGIDVALKEIEQGRGTAYDSDVVDACIRLFTEKRFSLPN